MKSIDIKKPLTILADEGAFKVNIKELNMTSTSLQQITVPFHNAELFLVEHNGQPYTPMKPIVDGIGMDWASQFVKLKQRFASTIVEITIVANDGKERLMTCLPVRKLFGWLMTISPNKVKPELRDTVIKYQEECDDVLWDYWTKGIAVNPRSTKEEREPLTNAVNLLVAKTKHLNYSDAYKLVHQRFNVKHIDEIPYDEIPVAVEYVHYLIALYSQTEKQGSLFDKDDYELIRQMTEAILAQNGAMDNVWKALELIDPLFINNYASYILKSNSLARKVSADFDFRTKRGQPLVDSLCRTINLSSGHRIGVNPKWFNAPAW